MIDGRYTSGFILLPMSRSDLNFNTLCYSVTMGITKIEIKNYYVFIDLGAKINKCLEDNVLATMTPHHIATIVKQYGGNDIDALNFITQIIFPILTGPKT